MNSYSCSDLSGSSYIFQSDSVFFPLSFSCDNFICDFGFSDGSDYIYYEIDGSDSHQLSLVTGNINYFEGGKTYNFFTEHGIDDCMFVVVPVNDYLFSGNVDNWSAIYINDIQHQSAGLINLTIPDEIAWDYTNTGDVFDLVVSGYNVDTQYMDDILKVQSYHPSSEDFTQSFTGIFTLIFPYIIICLFVIFVWKLLKRIFK